MHENLYKNFCFRMSTLLQEDNQENDAKKELVPGVIYLSFIPPCMNVKKVRELLQTFGEIGRVYLTPGKTAKPGKPSKYFTEGWVEFKNKKVAKRTARMLNGTQVGGKRRSPYYDSLWSMKYLKKFQWSHLTEQNALERAMKNQRLRKEIGKAKKEVELCQALMERKERIKQHKKKTKEKKANQNQDANE